MILDLTNFKEKWDFLADRKIFIGLSGGVDSIVLLRIFVLCGFDVEALHVNYQLRGADSDLDEEFVRVLCQQLNVPLTVRKIDTNAILDKEGGNLQAVARKVRYDFFNSFLVQNKQAFLAIAHHRDDQIETFFLNLARKSGLRGLACMLEIDQDKIRPLLPFSKEEIIRFAKQNHWDWREDKSNASLKYSRNVFRNKYIPEMQQYGFDIDEAVIVLVDAIQKELREVKDSISDLVQKILKTGFLKQEDFSLLSQNQQVEILFTLGLNSVELKSFYNIVEAQKGKFIETKSLARIFKEKEGFSFEYYYPKVEMHISLSYPDKLPVSFTKNEFYFDAKQIQGEIRLRLWQQNDRIKPLGMKGSKLISDVLHDANINSIERLRWPVIVDENEVLACPFHVVSRSKIATNKTEEIICVKVQREGFV